MSWGKHKLPALALSTSTPTLQTSNGICLLHQSQTHQLTQQRAPDHVELQIPKGTFPEGMITRYFIPQTQCTSVMP